MKKYVYAFNEGSREVWSLLGAKGENLAKMTRMGLPTPFGFTISTTACQCFFEENEVLSQEILDQIREKIGELEQVTGHRFGSSDDPLLVSVRAGAGFAMPAAGSAVLNLGLNEESVEGLAARTGDRRFALDCYRRFLQAFGMTVLHIPQEAFSRVLQTEGVASGKGELLLHLWTEDSLTRVIRAYKRLMETEGQNGVPTDPEVQLITVISALFRQWNGARARQDDASYQSTQAPWTAVNVQAMVFGNKGKDSCSGIAFTRNPENGEKQLSGGFLADVQGDDIARSAEKLRPLEELRTVFPAADREFIRIAELLEKYNRDMQEIEFTIEDNKLYILQTRAGKRSAQAAVKIAVDMAEEGVIDKKTALLRLNPDEIDISVQENTPEFTRLMEWADDVREMRVRVNADSAEEAAKALALGAEGIGLCRTEHMFLEPARRSAIQEMLLAERATERDQALKALRQYQQKDFCEIFRVMGELPVAIRLLDPLLQTLLPKNRKELHALAKTMGIPVKTLIARIDRLHETNPILGHRGCRLAVVYPEIAKMQTEAIVTAALTVQEELDIDILPEILIPLPVAKAEFKLVKETVRSAAAQCANGAGKSLPCFIGAMIETPRAALVADEIAEEADFFSFGTNDLTQMTFGFSKGDGEGDLIKTYVKKGILAADPFFSIDVQGVGRLMEMAVRLGRQMRPKIKLGICGEQGGDPKTIAFCQRIGLNYVSCAPLQVPTTRLSAAQAAVRSKKSSEEA